MKKSNDFYDNAEVLKKLDKNGKKPSVIIVTGNRTAGKTTSFLMTALDNFIDNGEQAIFIYRYSYELNSVDLLFSDVVEIKEKYNGLQFTTIAHAKGLFYEIMCGDKTFGFSVSLSNVDSLKKYSPVFNSVTMAIFDEYQKEDGKYLKKEVEKIQSLMFTVSRGGGQAYRHVLLVMLGNYITNMNPHLIYFDLYNINNQHFVCGDGFIAEFVYNDYASIEVKKGGLYSAFKKSKYTKAMVSADTLLNDNVFLMKKIPFSSKYIATLKIYDKLYGLREINEGIHISKKVDKTCKYVVAFFDSDHSESDTLVSRKNWLYILLNESYENSKLFVEDVEVKKSIFDVLKIDLY